MAALTPATSTRYSARNPSSRSPGGLELEHEEPSEDLRSRRDRIAFRTRMPAETPSSTRGRVDGRGRARQRHRSHGEDHEHRAPAEPGEHRGRERERPDDRTDRARDDPPRHVRFAALRRRIHQVAWDRPTNAPEAGNRTIVAASRPANRRQPACEEREAERDAAGDDDGAGVSCVAREADRWFDGRGHQAGHGQEQPIWT